MKRKTFLCDESMVITIPIGNLRNARDGELMPQKFYCVFKDSYKVFARNGKPKSLGAAQVITGIFLLTLGFIFNTKMMKWNVLRKCIYFFLWSIVVNCYTLYGLIIGLLFMEDIIAIFLMYWLSKAVCRDNFNSLPTILLKQGD
uniref:Uncharacterized protein n=1 Tax=Periophthalmus magnuspinnatus TaxID=409849 RepID=A0A3B4AEA3_9GOBI